MKKLILLICIILLNTTIANAEITPSELVFEHDTNGKYIYCNNREFIFRSDLADNSNEYAKFIMNNEDLTPDKYAMFISHVNHTDVRDTWTIFQKGFDIEVDVLFRAKEDTVLKITAVGFEVPENKQYYLNGEAYTKEEEWGCFKAWATYMQLPVSQIDSGQKYYPDPFEPVEITIPAGEKVWLSKYIPNYGVVPYYRPVNMLADFEIVSGKLDANVAAFRSTGTLGDRSHFVESALYGSYTFERQHKGVANSLNNVNAELNFTIDDSVVTGTLLPVTVYNQYAPEGKTVTTWFTNLNPRSDIWNKDNVAESCMLAFEYKDDAKLLYYGKDVPDSEKDNIWRIDTKHSDRYIFPGANSGFKASTYKPNYELREDENEDNAASLGNFGVFQNYKITITNNGMYDRYVNYNLNTVSNNLIILRDENGELIEPYPITKGSSLAKERDNLASVKLPAQKTTTFNLTVLLTTNYVGGMENRLEISDTPAPVKVYQSAFAENVKDATFTGREFLKWDNGKLYKSTDKKEWTEIELTKETKKIFEGRHNTMKIVYMGDCYMAKSTLYDGIPYYYVRDFYRDVYFFDDNFNLISQKDFGAYPTDISGGNGYYYVKAGSLWFSKGDGNWKLINSEFSMPVSNYSDKTAAYKNGKIHLSPDGENFYPVKHYTVSPSYIDSLGDLYYFTKDNLVYVSRNGINFTPIFSNEPIRKLGKTKNALLINDKEYQIPDIPEMPVIFTGTEYIEYVGEVIRENGKCFIPLRSYAAAIGAEVTWNSDTGSANLITESGIKSFSTTYNVNEADENVLWLNGDTSYICK